ncbi:type II secretory pathway%2C component PulF [Clostridium baratii]|uniref:Type II secretion system (T2SS), F family protein n=1 Tax=Clostridium baratii str. Sullivan TaxID=1415775 RepID=A0A0A7FS15_9CLOT|nr:type II secretion system F family protein [Clostridium baratii]AIY82392.1 type II secretion system (T2SS), F family protein [Clostridium baratii str. Sullivan]CUP66421.1 type II secretory pathway%2C component PulF [Clostridium baratii]
MAIYKYEARNVEGVTISGTLEAQAKSEVVNSLRQRGYFPTRIFIEDKSKDINIELFNKVTLKDLSLFCRQFAFVVQSGTPMLRAVELSMQQTENKKLKEILGRVYDQVQKGRSLSDAFKFEEEIPGLMTNMIAAGEASGRLEHIMNELSEYYRKQYKQKQKVSQATMYPKIIVVFTIMVVSFLLVKVVPDFVQNLSGMGGDLPIFTKILMTVGEFAKKTWIFFLIGGLLAYGYKVFFLNKDENYRVKSGKRSLEGRIFGRINRQLVAGRFANTFAILTSSGLGVIQALEISGQVLENAYIEKKLNEAKEDVKKGHPIGKTIEDLNIFPVMLTQMVTVGEETGALEDILVKTSEFYDGEVETAIEKMTTMIEPILIMVLAVVVLFIVMALLLPMFNMMDAVQKM